MTKVYSTNGEEFDHEELDEAVDAAIDNSWGMPTDILAVSEGDKVPFRAGDFLVVDDLLEILEQRAWFLAEDYARGWPGVSLVQKNDLAELVAAAINTWADGHCLQPTFFLVKNVKEIKIKLLDTKGAWEIVQ
jgi:hypothetical protein